MDPIGRVGGAVRAQASSQAAPTPEMQKARKVSREFEEVMLTHSFETMMKGVKTPGLAGGSSAEGMWRSFMVQEMAKDAVRAGGIGVADQVYREMTGQMNGVRK